MDTIDCLLIIRGLPLAPVGHFIAARFYDFYIYLATCDTCILYHYVSSSAAVYDFTTHLQFGSSCGVYFVDI